MQKDELNIAIKKYKSPSRSSLGVLKKKQKMEKTAVVAMFSS